MKPQGAEHKTLSRRLVDRYGRQLRAPFNNFVQRYSLIGQQPVFDPKEFDYLRRLEARWEEIRAEADAVMAGDRVPSLSSISPDHQELDNQGKWRTYFLWGYGIKVPRQCERCPTTAALVEKIPGLLTAMFSIHEPGAHLPRHRGVTKGMLTYHLGLHVPDNCHINVEDTDYRWREGEFFVFDDTCYHETFNHSDRDRVILLLHVRRPLRAPGSWVQELFFWGIRRSPFVQDVKKALNV
ncbi:MAG: aspartyl/asparaginyl beta-hydroxylase domain-containing protein [Arenicellales bacterium]